ncbi:MAG: pitrilysin family protein [Caldimonas sp.]
MTVRRVAGLVVAACLAAGAIAATPPAAAAAPVAGALQVPRIDYRQRKLANGLTLISVESHASPTVSVQVWYRVGGSDDPAGKSGFAHLFEHMMFKSTRYLKSEQFDRLTEDVGGNNNASTSEDVTAYEDVVPSNHLETLLWAEAERMMNLKVDEPALRSERSVVEEEYRERVLASPYGRFSEAIRTEPYLQHPYRRGVIGSIADLEAATLADVVAFHATHYRPDNATLVVSGDFDPRQLDAWVDRYFAPVTRPVAPLPVRGASEPAWPGDRTITVKAPKVPLPAVAAVWLAPPLTDRDAPALQVAAALLSAGESSRLNQSLVYRQQIATQAGFSADLRSGPGLLIATAIVASGKQPAAVRSALLAEVRRLVDRPASPGELEKIKVQILTGAFSTRQTPLGLGAAIAEAAVLGGDPNRVNTDLDDLRRVSAADVQRVLRRYVLGAHKVSFDYVEDASAK